MSKISDWAKQQADSLKPALEEKQLNDKLRLEDERQKRVQGMPFWELVFVKVQEVANAVNAEMRRPVVAAFALDSTHCVLSFNASAGRIQAKMSARFSPEACTISWDDRVCQGAINETTGNLEFSGMYTMSQLDAEGIAQAIVGDALEKLKK